MPDKPIYLDYAATTPLDPEVLAAMQPYFALEFGNPASVHRYGQAAEQAVERARETVAGQLHAEADEIVFTGGGTEANNLAIRGAALAARAATGANHLVATPVEHPSVLETCRQLADHLGFELTLLPVDEFGQVQPQAVLQALRPTTAVVSIICASNEVGTLQPIAQIAAVLRGRGVVFHTDAVQAAGPMALDVEALGIDLLTIGAHKFYGPKGAGALVVRRGTRLLPTQTGGAHEHGLRAGTPNVAYIVGLAEALHRAGAARPARVAHCRRLRDRLIREVLERIPDAHLTGHPDQRLPNHASFVFDGVNGHDLLTHLDVAGFACSSGSACKTGDPRPSEGLLAMGIDPDRALGSLRVTVGAPTTDAEVDRFLDALPQAVARLRALELV